MILLSVLSLQQCGQVCVKAMRRRCVEEQCLMCFPRSKNCFDEDFLQHAVVTVPASFHFVHFDTRGFSRSQFFLRLIMKPAACRAGFHFASCLRRNMNMFIHLTLSSIGRWFLHQIFAATLLRMVFYGSVHFVDGCSCPNSPRLCAQVPGQFNHKLVPCGQQG